MHRLAADDARRLHLEAALLGGVQRALAVDGLTEAVDDAPDERVADGHREDPAGRLDRAALLDVAGLTEDDRTDRLLVEVQGEAERAALELEHLVDRGLGQARDAGDAVADFEHAADVRLLEGRRERRDVLTQRRGDLVCVDRQFRHVDLLPQLFESVTDGAVDHEVTHPGDDASEHGRVDDDLHLDVFPRRPVQRFAQPVGLLGRELDRAAHLGHRPPLLGRRQLDEPVDDRGQLAGPAGGDDERRQRGARLERLPAEQVLDHRDPPLGRQRGIGERGPQLVGPLEGPGEPEQLVLDVGEVPLGAAHLEQRVGVRLDAGGRRHG